MKMNNNNSGRQVLFRQHDITRLAHRLLSLRQKENQAGISGIPFYIAPLDEVMRPVRGGELVTILASTSHYKTGMMTYLARNAAQDMRRISRRVDGKTEVFFYCTWEDSIEKIGVNDIANATGLDIEAMEDGRFNDEQMMMIMQSIIDRHSYPLYLIGHSERSMNERPRLTLQQVHSAINVAVREIGQDKVQVGGIFLDYLQRIPVSSQSVADRRMWVAGNVELCKDMAIQYNCPVYLGCQAGRQVAERDIKIPTRFDGLETSNIEQTSDRLLALYMPKFDHRLMDLLPTDYVTETSEPIYVTEDLLVVEVLKQKRGSTGIRIPLRVKFNTNQIEPL